MLSVLSKTFLKIILNFCDSFSFDKYCPFEHFLKVQLDPGFNIKMQFCIHLNNISLSSK